MEMITFWMKFGKPRRLIFFNVIPHFPPLNTSERVIFLEKPIRSKLVSQDGEANLIHRIQKQNSN